MLEQKISGLKQKAREFYNMITEIEQMAGISAENREHKQVISIMKAKKMFGKRELMQLLADLKEASEWNCGENKTLRIIDELVAAKILKQDTGYKNKKTLVYADFLN